MMSIIIKAKKVLTLLLLGAIISTTFFKAPAKECEAYTDNDTVIALDAGHYFSEPGKRSPYDSFWGREKREVQYNLDMVRRVEAKIKEQRPDIQIYLTNPNGTDTTRSQRAVNAKNANVDMLFSLHMNAIGDEWQDKVKGTCICINKHSEIGVKRMAQKFVDQYSKDTGIKKVCTDGLYERGAEVGILDKATKLGLPAILIEMDFMDNYEVYRNFGDNDYLDMIAESIANNIIQAVNDGGY